MIIKFKLFENFSYGKSESYAKKICDELGYVYIRKISSGAFGTTFKIKDKDDGVKCLKITSEKSEAMTADKLRKKPYTKHLINFYDVRYIKSFESYAIIEDYIRNLNDLSKENVLLYQVIKEIVESVKSNFDDNTGLIKKTDFLIKSIVKYILRIENIKKLNVGEEDVFELVVKYFNQVIDLQKEMKKYHLGKLLFSDFQTGNVGLDEYDNLKFFDIMSESMYGKSPNLKLKELDI